MPMSDRIRALVLGLIRAQDRILVFEGYDCVDQQYFYRCLGGGIEFGEPSEMALHREFQEELGAALTNVRYLGCIESIFQHDGRAGHEIVQLYGCDFVDPRFYAQERIEFTDEHSEDIALWLPVERFQRGELTLYPTGMLAYL